MKRVGLVVASLVATLGMGGCASESPGHPELVGASAQRGKALIEGFECGVCHVIPGVRGAHSHVGPSLQAFRANIYVAGRYPHTPQIVAAFVRDAPALSPGTAMPAFEMSEAQARDIAAYLYTLE